MLAVILFMRPVGEKVTTTSMAQLPQPVAAPTPVKLDAAQPDIAVKQVVAAKKPPKKRPSGDDNQEKNQLDNRSCILLRLCRPLVF